MKRTMMTTVMAAIMGGMVFVPPAYADAPTLSVENVVFRQRYPWNGLVDIDCTVDCEDPMARISLYVSAIDKAANKSLMVKNVWLEGDATQSSAISVTGGTYRIVWNAVVDNPSLVADDVVVKVQAILGSEHYLVVDLSGGPDAAHYSVSYLDAEPQGGWTDEYKTTKLVLRRIPAGSFIMGCETNEVGYYGYEAIPHTVMISNPFYMGTFEVTQRQYELIMGSNPSSVKGDMRPVESVSYVDIRGLSDGAGWPSSSEVGTASFMGVLRTKTGITTFDLPTEAKWEYACRAGTSTALNSGKDLTNGGSGTDPQMDEVGRYYNNRSDGKGGYSNAHTTVGSYQSNCWGLYDMHGNVWEWTLDWFTGRDSFTSAIVEDPMGPATGSGRVRRGGGWRSSSARFCRSAHRLNSDPDQGEYGVGFRLCCSDGSGYDNGLSAWAESLNGRLDMRTEISTTNLPFGATLASKLYVTNGLVAHFDGIRNTGVDRPHNPNATTWVNLGSGGSANNATLTTLSSNVPSGATDGEWTDSGYYFKGKQYFAIGGTINLEKEATVQLATEWTTSIGDCPGVSWPLMFGGSSVDRDAFGIWHDKDNFSYLNLKILNMKRYVTNWDGYSLNAVFDGVNSRCSISKDPDYIWQTGMPNNAISSANTNYVIGTAGLNNTYKGLRMFKGVIRAVRIYDRILTPEELAWNQNLDGIRFRGDVKSATVVVASNIDGAEGIEACGQYFVNGHHTFTAPASTVVNGHGYNLTGYKLEIYNPATGAWELEGEHDGTSFAYTNCFANAGARITWQWLDSDEPVTAVWTGGAHNNDFSDPGNWICTNTLGQATVNSVVPDERTKNYILNADADWTSSEWSLAPGSTFDLAGHKLYTSSLSGADGTAGTTDYVFNGSFENGCSFTVNSGEWAYQSDITFSNFGWTGGSGISKEIGTWKSVAAPGGSAVWFFQRDANVSTTVTVPESGFYTVTFCYGGRSGTDNNGNRLNGVIHLDVGAVRDCTTVSCSSTSSTQKTVNNVFFAKGDNTLTFRHDRNGIKDTCSWIDVVTVKRSASSGICDSSTDVANPGELHVAVSSGGTLSNSTVAIGGNLKLVKEGAGTLVMAKTQMYSGGNVVAAGVMRPCAADGTGRDLTHSYDNEQAWGPRTRDMITVLPGGVFDTVGNWSYRTSIVLAGGMYRNSGTAMSYSYDNHHGCGPSRLSADSEVVINVTSASGGTSGDPRNCHKLGSCTSGWDDLDLGGHTMTCTINSGKHCYLLYAYITNGTFVATGAGWLRPWAGTVNMRTATLDVGCPINMGQTINVDNYIARYAGTSNAGSSPLNVYGTFKPIADNFYGCTMQDGSIIDLSSRSGTWTNTAASFTAGTRTVSFVSGCTVTIYTGVRDVAAGDKLISWMSQPDAIFTLSCAGETADERELEVELRSDGLYLRSTAIPAFARRDVANDAWIFYKSDGTIFPGEWTGGITSDMYVKFSTYAEFAWLKENRASVPARYFKMDSLTFESGSEIYDFSAGWFDFDYESVTTIDVNGNYVKLPYEMLTGGVLTNVTSSTEGGTLEIEVPSGVTFSNSALALSGGLGVVKSGAGTYIGARAQTYTGDTIIAAGKAQPPDAPSDSNIKYCRDQFKAFGTGGIRVSAGATFDLRANYAYYGWIKLDGGTLVNSGPHDMNQQGNGGSGIGGITADSTLNVTRSIMFENATHPIPGGCDLGGNTLTVDIAVGKKWYLRSSSFTNGVISITNGGWLQTVETRGYTMIDASTVDFKVNCALNLVAQLDVRNYEALWSGQDYNMGSAALNVHGTFKPSAHDCFYGCTLLDGSVIDLSLRTNALPTTAAFTGKGEATGRKTLSFASGAEITVNLAERSDLGEIVRSESPYIITWSTKPADTVSFVLDDYTRSQGYVVEVDDGGLHLINTNITNRRPVVESVSPADTMLFARSGEGFTFHIAANDPDGDSLTYLWTMDGATNSVATTAPDYHVSLDAGDLSAHMMTCVVTDGFWTIPVGTTWTFKNGYDVTFDLGDFVVRTGGGELSQLIEAETAAVAPEVRGVEGYDFDGWDVDFNNVVSNMTVHAKYLRLARPVAVENLNIDRVVTDSGASIVEFSFNVTCDDPMQTNYVYLVARDDATGTEWPMRSLVGRDALAASAYTNGTYHLTWNASTDLPAGIVGNIRIHAFATAHPLAHRWGFNGNYLDTAGMMDATATGSVTLSNGAATLAGGTRGSSYITLGQEVFPGNDQPRTIELWARQNAVKYWGLIFQFGTSTRDYIYMSWTRESNLNTDGARAYDASVVYDHMSPYSLGVDYHIAMTFDPMGDNIWNVCCYKQENATGETLARVNFTCTNAVSLVNSVSKTFYLGHSFFSDEQDASATYDEVRIWNAALREPELTQNVLSGADIATNVASATSAAFPVVTFDLDGHGMRVGGGELVQVLTNGMDAVAPEIDDAIGWRFIGWDRAFTNVVESMVVTARYDVVAYNVSFNIGEHGVRVGGGELAQTVQGGTAAVEPLIEGVPVGHVFAGWDGNTAFVTNDTVFTAQYATNITGIIWRNVKNGGQRLGWDLPLESYTLMGETNTIDLIYKSGHASNPAAYLSRAQNRFDGWFYVPADKAGEWLIRQGYDDYMAFGIDGEWLIQNETYTTKKYADWTATQGWHRFSIVCGDTGGDYGCLGTWVSSEDGQWALAVSINGGGLLPFESTFRFGGDDGFVSLHLARFNLGEHGSRTGGGGLVQFVYIGDAAEQPIVEPDFGWLFDGWSRPFTNVTESIDVAAQYVTAFPFDATNAMDGVAYEGTFGNLTGIENVTWSASGLPEGLTLSADGTISGTVLRTGAFSFTLTATAPNGDSRTIPLSIYVVENPNHRPVVEATNPSVATSASLPLTLPGDTLEFSVQASDPDGDSLSYVWLIDGVTNAVNTTGAFTWTPEELDGGTRIVTCLVTDGFWSIPAVWRISIPKWYVSGDGVSTNAGTTTAAPFREIQNAVEAAAEEDVIFVSEGVYGPINTANKQIRVIATGALDKTIIDGGGTNRSATLGSSLSDSVKTTLKGFTLRNGYADRGGGVLGGILYDCIVESNHATSIGGGAAYSELRRCVIRNNVCNDDGGGASYCNLYNSLVCGNHAVNHGGGPSGGGIANSSAWSCTITKNTADTTTGGAGVCSSSLIGSIVWANLYTDGTSDSPYNSTASYTCFESQFSGTGNIQANPRFVDAEGGDFRLLDHSPCIDACLVSYDAGETDLAGNARVAGSAADMGCYEGGVELHNPGQAVDFVAAKGRHIGYVRLSWGEASNAWQYRVERAMDESFEDAVSIGTTEALFFDDTNVVSETAYWYRVVGVNPAGEGSASAADSGWCMAPLVFGTNDLAVATAGLTYHEQLVVSGGSGSYNWTSGADDYDIYGWESTYLMDIDSPRGLLFGDDVSTVYPLPFDFPFYGKSYNKLWISSNGTLTFDGDFTTYTPSLATFKSRVMIAPFWKDLLQGSGGVYVSENGEESVTFMWYNGAYYSGHGLVNASVTLFADGSIVCSYGDGNANGAFVGVSAGDGTRYRHFDLQGRSLDNADDIVFFPQDVPGGLALSADGVLSGKPTAPGEYVFTVFVTDEYGNGATRQVSVTVEENPNMRQVTFNLGEYGVRGGGGELRQYVLLGENAVAPTVRVMAGWVFDGWTGTFTNIADNVTVSAKYRSAYADLHVDEVTVRRVGDNVSYQGGAQLDATAGDTLTVSWSVGNTGNPAFTGKMTEYVRFIDATNPGNAIVMATLPFDGTIARDGSMERNAEIKLPLKGMEGEWIIEIETAVNPSVREYTGNNTRRGATVTVAECPLPDLVVFDMMTSVQTFMPGDTVTVAYVEANFGGADIVTNWFDRIALEDASGKRVTLVGRVVLNAPDDDTAAAWGQATLPADAAVTNVVECVIPEMVSLAGDVRFVVEADFDNSIVEIDDETNNVTRSESVMLGRRLYMVSASDSVKENVSSGVRFTVKRSGPVDDAAEVTVMVGRVVPNAPGGGGLGQAALPDEVTFPSTVTIPAGSVSTVFYVKPIDNTTVEGPRTLHVSASSDGFVSGAPVPLTILDDEVPHIYLALDKTSIREGDGVIIATVTRELVTDEPLTVYLTGASTSRCSYPSSVVIPAREASVTFEISVPNNATAQIAQELTLRASSSGYTSAAVSYTVEDDDVPGVTLSLTPEVVSEGAGANAIYATLMRSDTNQITQAVRVRLTASAADQLILPSEIIIPKYTMGVRFAIGVIDNALDDGDREIEINGAIVIESCGCNGQPSNGDVIQGVVGIIDNDGPALSLSASPTTMKEGLDPAGYLTLSHNSTLTEDLTIRLWADMGGTGSVPSAATGEIEIPATVTIPAGQTSVRIPVKTLDDGVEDGGQLVSVYAEVDGDTFSPASTWIQVSDQNLPDLAVANVDAVASVVAMEDFEVPFTVTNIGFMATSRAIPYVAYLVKGGSATSYSSYLAMKTGTLRSDGALAVGGSVSSIVTFTAPELPGSYRVAIVLDPERTISELDTANNTRWSNAVGVGVAYTAVAAVVADVDYDLGLKVFQPGETVTITGIATRANGAPAANVRVDPYVTMNGARRSLLTTTGGDGTFAVTFTPSSSEAGNYGVGACYPGINSTSAQDSFSIPGWRVSASSQIYWDIKIGDTETRTITIQNRSSIPLTGLTATFGDIPEECEFSYTLPTVIPGNGSVTLRMTAKAIGITEQTQFKYISLCITADGGYRFDKTLGFHSMAQQAQLRTTPGSINTTMAIGHTRYVDVTVYNDGRGDSGRVTASIPNVNWLKIVGGASIDNLASGESATITLAVSPTTDDGLVLNNPLSKGSMAVNCANGYGTSVSLRFTPVSEATGGVTVDVVDNNTYYLESAPHLANATVRISNPYTGATVVTGTTGANGIWSAANIPEGRYQLTITAPNHDTYADEITIEPSKMATVTSYLQSRLVTANLVYEKTTIEDQYEITLLLDFATDVPAPVVRTVLPSELPVLNEGESYAFTITLENSGVIAAEKVTLTMPDIKGYEFELSDNDIKLPAKSSMVISAVLRRSVPMRSSRLRASGSGSDEVVCWYLVRTGVEYVCGREHPVYSYQSTIKHGSCNYASEAMAHALVETYNGILGGGGGSSGGNGGVPSRTGNNGGNNVSTGGFISGSGSTYQKKNCDPCLSAIAEAKAKSASDTGWALWGAGRDFLLGKIPFSGCVDLLVNGLMTYNPLINDGIKYLSDLPGLNVFLKGHFESYSEKRSVAHGVFSAALDAASCGADVLAAIATVSTGGTGAGSFIAAAEAKEVLARVKAFQETTLEPISNLWQLEQLDEKLWLDIVLKELDPNSEYYDKVRLNCNVGSAINDRLVRDIEDLVVAREKLEEEIEMLEKLLGDLLDEMQDYGNETIKLLDEICKKLDDPDFSEFDPEETVKTVYPDYEPDFSVPYDGGITLDDLDDIVITSNPNDPDPPDDLSDPEKIRDWKVRRIKRQRYYKKVVKYLDDVNDALDEWDDNMAVTNSPVAIDAVLLNMINLRKIRLYMDNRGFDSLADMIAHAVDDISAIVDGASDSVCAQVTLKISQTLAMTREVVDGTLTLHNGNGTVDVTNMRLDVSVLDTDGNECKDLFEIFANGTEGDMSDGDILAGGLSVRANGTGIGKIRLVPKRDAAPEVDTVYHFGGTLTYTDPFTGETATIDFVRTTLTICPSPYLHLDYFVQRDVYADDPFTANIVEASMPAELAVLVRNVGAGDANKVTIASAKPEKIKDEKGSSIDFDLKDYLLDASALNGATAHLGLNTVSLGTIVPNESKVAQWWLTSTIEGHFIGMSATVTPVNSWNTPDSMLVDPDVGTHMLVRSIVADGDTLPDFLVCDGTDLYGTPNEIYTARGDVLQVCTATVATSATLPAGGEIELPITLLPRQSGWNYGYAAIPGIFRYTISRIVRGDGTEIPIRNAWITDRTFRDGNTPLLEERLHIVDEFASETAQAYTVYLAAKPSDVPEVAAFEGITGGAIEYAARNEVTVVFSKPIDPTTFTLDDLTLIKQGAYVDDLSVLTITAEETNTRFVIGNLSALCGEYGRYELTVQCAGIADTVGQLGTVGMSVAWTHSTTEAPYVIGADGVPTRRVRSLDSITVTFSAPVDPATFTTDTLRLNNETVGNNVAITALDDSGTRFVVTGFDNVQTHDGEYSLTVDASMLTGLDGTAGVDSYTATWTRDTIAPMLQSLTHADGLNGTEFILTFSEDVEFESLTPNKVTLKRNNSVVALPGTAQLRRLGTAASPNDATGGSPSSSIDGEEVQWVLSGIDSALMEDGEYELSFSANGVRDEAGNAASGSRSVSWTVDNTPPAQIVDLAISPDGGFSDTDGVTYTNVLTVTGTLPEDGLSIEILARYVGGGETVLLTINADATSASLPFSQNITLPSSGNVTLVVRLIDAAGNSSETEKGVYVDGIALTGSLTGASEDEGVITASAILSLSDRVMEGDVMLEKFSLTRDGGSVALDGVTLAARSASAPYQWELSGLDALCAEDGQYVLRFDGSAVRKYTSGLLMSGSTLTMTWRYENPDREPPTVTEVLFDGEMPHEAYTNVFSSVSVTFSEAVNVPELIANGLIGRAARIDLLDVAGAVTGCVTAVAGQPPYQWNAEANTLAWQIDSLSVPAGRTRLMLDAGLIKDLAGNRLGAERRVEDNAPYHAVATQASGLRTYALAESVMAQVNAQAMPMWYNGELYVGERIVDNKGKIRHYTQLTTHNSQLSTSWTYLQSEGVDIEVPAQGCQGASVAFADMDGDGVAETYVGTAGGDVLRYPGGTVIASLGTARAMPYAYDIDGDGRDELVVGGMDGKIRVVSLAARSASAPYQGEGGSQSSATETYTVTVLTDVNGVALSVPNGRAAPIVADINHDGLADIVSGDTAGNVWAYLGWEGRASSRPWTGQSPSLPVLATPVCVYTNSVGLADRSRIGYGDVDGDGIEDLIVGRSDGSVTAMLGAETPSPIVPFAVKAIISASASTHGAITPVGDTAYDGGDTPEYTITPDVGYHVADVQIDGVSIGATNNYVFAPLTTSHAIYADFATIPYSITYTGLKGATNTNPETYTVEDAITFTTPGEVYGWVFKGWSPASIARGTTGAIEVTANWERAKFDVTVNGETRQYDYEEEVTFTAPEPTVDDLCRTQLVYVGTTFTAPVVTNEFTVSITNGIEFAWDIFATNYWFETERPVNGAVEMLDGDGGHAGRVTLPGWMPDGTNFTIVAVPAEHYHFTGWTGDWRRVEDNAPYQGEAENPLAVTMDQSRTIGATFAIDTFAVTFEAGAHGALSGEIAQTIDYGATAAVPGVTPDAGYEFIGWSGDVSAPVTSNATFTAQYATIPYAISYTGLKGATNTNPETYTVEDEITFTAPGEVYGWVFKGWTPDSIALGSTGEIEVTANWERAKFDVTVNGETRQYDYEDVAVFTTNSVINFGATQYVCKGWTATNAGPSSGEGARAEFRVLGDAVLDWLWETNVITLAQSINAEGFAWTTGGAAMWMPEWADDAADGLHQARSGAVQNGTNAWLATTVEGPGTLAFKWRSALASRNTKYQFMVDGEVKGMLTGTNDWTEVSFKVFGDRAHEIKWRLMTGRSGFSAGDWVALDCVVWTQTVPPTLAEALNTNLVWITDGDALWRGVARESLTDIRDAWAVVSGLGDDGTSAVQTRVYGSGILFFDWAISCEEDYDWMELTVDGEVREYISGSADWTQSAVEIVGDGWHVVRWEFIKDEMDDPELAGENIARLDNVVWNSDNPAPMFTETQTTPVPVPYSELETNFKSYLDAAEGDYEAAANMTGRNGYAIWESYLAGLDPDDEDSKFRAKIEMMSDGTVMVTWEPDTPELRKTREYTTYGKKTLSDGEWTPVTDADKDQYRFFKVEVRMK